MGLITNIDQAIKKVIYSIFWWFIDPLEHERLFSQLVDAIERNLEADDPQHVAAPDRFDVYVNNTIFIKHAHSIKKLEAAVQNRIQKYMAQKEYELSPPKIKLQIISSATVSKRKAEVRCWFSSDENEGETAAKPKKLTLSIIAGEGKGLSWALKPGQKYTIGRLSTSAICLPFHNISKRHASLEVLSEDKIRLVDEGSANGTFINDEINPIKGSRDLCLTDKIKFCKLNPIIMTITTE